MKKTGLIAVGMLSIFIVILVGNTMRFSSKQLNIESAELEELDSERLASRLSDAIQIKTISHQDPSKMDVGPFIAFHALLERSYPVMHKTLEKKIVNTYSLLYKWPGKNPALKPIAFLAHYDVVPVESGTEKHWTFEPFSGEISQGFVWGRGTLDMKGTLMAIMESVEKLIGTGFSPDRTIYLAFGHDEEVGGVNGAGQIVTYLKKQGIQFLFTLDEGMVVLNPQLSPSKKNLAIIGIAEKGSVTLKITAKGAGGHSSMPGITTTLGILGRAVVRLEENQMQPTLAGPVGDFFDYIGPDMPFLQKLLFANQWAFKPLILSVLGKSKTTNAMIRTTTAPTMIQGGAKENVLPGAAHLIVNFRVLPGDTVQAVVAHAKKAIHDDRIEIEMANNRFSEPSSVSDITSDSFFDIKKTIGQIFPDTAIAPGLVLAGTDSKHYRGISENRYRFVPFILGPEDTSRIHGTDERVSVQGYTRAIQFYIQLMKNTAGKQVQANRK